MACCSFRCCSLLVVIFAAFFAWASIPAFSKKDLIPSLAGQVAVVTGASRGIGKGIAVGLGEAGATVYITGRTLSEDTSNEAGVFGQAAPGSLEETCKLVVKAGGKCIPVAVNSASDSSLEELFERVINEHGRLDVLVNNAFSGLPFLSRTYGQPFWEKGPEMWDAINRVGLRSHYVASVFATRTMSPLKRGLIINVGSFGGIDYIFDVAYGIGKAGMDRMAHDMAIELFTENITMVSLWPGLVKTENVEDGALESKMAVERRGKKPASPDLNFSQLLSTPCAETPLFNGRAVASLARDPHMLKYTGRVVVPSIMASGYGFVDERGVRSPPMTSLKFAFAAFLFRPLLEKHGLWNIPGEVYTQTAEASADARFFWNRLPDLTIPGFLIKLGAGAPDL